MREVVNEPMTTIVPLQKSFPHATHIPGLKTVIGPGVLV
jgi:hypothetical protein